MAQVYDFNAKRKEKNTATVAFVPGDVDEANRAILTQVVNLASIKILVIFGLTSNISVLSGIVSEMNVLDKLDEILNDPDSPESVLERYDNLTNEIVNRYLIKIR